MTRTHEPSTDTTPVASSEVVCFTTINAKPKPCNQRSPTTSDCAELKPVLPRTIMAEAEGIDDVVIELNASSDNSLASFDNLLIRAKGLTTSTVAAAELLFSAALAQGVDGLERDALIKATSSSTKVNEAKLRKFWDAQQKKQKCAEYKQNAENYTGLAEGYFLKNGMTYVVDNDGDRPICSAMCVLHDGSSIDGLGWGRNISVTNSRGETNVVCITRSQPRSAPNEAMAILCDAGLVPLVTASDKTILRALSGALAPIGYNIDQPGHHILKNGHIFALPTEMIGALPAGEVIFWDGNSELCNTGKKGTLAGWREHVARKAEGNPIVMASIGTMSASPVILYMESSAEANTVLHLKDTTSKGKTISLCVGSSVWGSGATRDRDSEAFIRSWNGTPNAMESVLGAYSNVGIALDELKQLSPAAGAGLAYLLSSGRGKDRLTRDIIARKAYTWNLFVLSSGK